jgi:hypothetical protein
VHGAIQHGGARRGIVLHLITQKDRAIPIAYLADPSALAILRDWNRALHTVLGERQNTHSLNPSLTNIDQI